MRPLKCDLGHPIIWKTQTVGYCEIPIHPQDDIALHRQWWLWNDGVLTALTREQARIYRQRGEQ